LERAHRTNVPAYRICPDATLEHLVCERPSTLDALRSIYGLGDSRVAAFGDELLDALRRALG
jgi:ATP-dependent DNA helicase RecQ